MIVTAKFGFFKLTWDCDLLFEKTISSFKPKRWYATAFIKHQISQVRKLKGI